MALSKKNITQATVATPAAPKGKGKTIEVLEPADRQPNLSDVHISDADNSHSNFASPRGHWTWTPANGKQLLHMLSIMRKQMEDQQTEMIWLRETAAREKEATTLVQTQLLKQIRTQQKPIRLHSPFV